MKLNKKLPVAITALGALVALTSCAGNSGNGDSPEGPIKLTWGLYQINASAAAFATISPTEGIAAKYNLEIEPSWVTDNATSLALLVSGETQASSGAIFGAIDSNVQGIPLDVVAELSVSVEGFSTIEALPDSGITDYHDFIGKTISVPSLNSTGHNRLLYLMNEAGMDTSQVNFVELPFDQVPGALEQGTIDAGSVQAAARIEVKDVLGTVTVFDTGSGVFNGLTDGGVYMTHEFVQANPDTVARFQCAFKDAVALLESDPDAYRRVVLEYTELTEEQLASVGAPGFRAVTDPEKIQLSADIMLSVGNLDEPFDASTIVVTAPTNCADYVVE
jgi:NitT/TauT family transport system substrate-binding protein